MKKTVFGVGAMLSGAIGLAGLLVKRGLGDYYSHSMGENIFAIMIGIGFAVALTAAYDIDCKALFNKIKDFLKNQKHIMKGDNKNETH